MKSENPKIVANLNDEFDYVSIDESVSYFKSLAVENLNELDSIESLFVKIIDGEVVEMFGIRTIVPYICEKLIKLY